MQVVHRTVDTKSRKICSVPQCSSYCTKSISLHNFPRDDKMKEKWKKALKIGKEITKYMLVCSLHFVDSDFTIATNMKRMRLKKNVVPSQKIPISKYSVQKAHIDRSQRHWLNKLMQTDIKKHSDLDLAMDVEEIVDLPIKHEPSETSSSDKICLEELKSKRVDLLEIIKKEESEEAVLERNISVLQEKLDNIQCKLKYHKQLYDDYTKTIQETEGGFKKILESSQTLLNLVQHQSNKLKNNSST